MSKKYFLIALIFICITFVAGGAAWMHQHFQNNLYTGGEPTFARTKAKISHLGKIVISAPNSSSITLYRQDGIWYFKEAKDYFANLGQLNDLLNMINDSEIILSEEATDRALKKYDLNEQSGILIQTYNLDDKLIDELIIGKKNKDKTCYARSTQTEQYIYRISSCGVFSADAADWVPFPLLSLEYHLFERVKSTENEFKYGEISRQIIKSVDMRRLILTLGALDYQGIMFKEEFTNNSDLSVKTRKLEVEMVDGLVYIFTIYNIDGDYWLDLEMKQGIVANKSVKSFIENNRKYYDKWLFQLDPYQGKILFNFSE